MSEESNTDTMIGLRGELAALQYKRDRLISELNEMRNQVRAKEQRAAEFEGESDRLKEQTARQSAMVTSLKQRVQELEERERTLSLAYNRAESALETLQRQCQEQEERSKELGMRVRELEGICHDEEEAKLATRAAMADHVRRLASALGEPEPQKSHLSQDCLLHKAADLLQMVSRLQSRSCTITSNLESVEMELRSCREALERAVADRENFQRQAANHLLALDRVKQEKEDLEIQKRIVDREMSELREKCSKLSKELVCLRSNGASQDAFVNQLKGDLQAREDKAQRAQAELRHLLESLAITLSTPARFVESTEDGVRGRIGELLDDNKDKQMKIEELKEKIHLLSNQLDRQHEHEGEVNHRIRALEEEKALLGGRINKLEEDLQNSNIVRENLRRDKNTFMSFLENLGRVMGMEECKEADLDLQTESLILRAEQFARMETDRMVDKTSTVYQLQRRVKTLKEQVQKKDLHLDLLRRKLAQQEENCRLRSAASIERDELALKCRKMVKQMDRQQAQLADARALAEDLRNQLAEAGDLKITALERGRKIEELQQRLVDSELLRTRYNRKIQMLKDQLRTTSQAADQERTIAEHSIQLLRDDLAAANLAMAECKRREAQLGAFRAAIVKTLSSSPAATDYELVTKLEKVVTAHREFTLLSRRYEESVPGTSPCPPRTPRYEDSGFIDHGDLDDNEDIYHKRPSRLGTH